MAFDECIENPSTRPYVKQSMERTYRWLLRCRAEMDRLNALPDTLNPHQMLFGINQGGVYDDLRIEHMKMIREVECDGYAIGGLSVGEEISDMYRIIDSVEPYMPKDKPRYLMGVGTPCNILEAVHYGIDFFDCVMPTRNARHGNFFTWKGKMNITNEKYARDARPIEEGCQCPACRNYSRSYIRHLIRAKEVVGSQLAVAHNLYFYNNLMKKIREALDGGYFESFYQKYRNILGQRVED
jgi:queuine tRNA-ribosyltransferase